jgi:dihydroorotate dehydrogenase (NAD+) catalytic subunit
MVKGVKGKALDLSVDIGGIRIKNPVMTASGTFGYASEFSPYMNLSRLGAIIVKGLSLKPRHGNPSPRIVETPCGMINAIGLQNVGVDCFIKEKLPFLRKIKTPVIANIFGETFKEYGEVARRLDGVKGVAGVEINISCPNVKKGGMEFGTDPTEAHRVVRAVKKATGLPVITKLSPNVTDISVMARAVEEAGTDAISLINTVAAMAVDVERRRPVLGTVGGGLSGPAIRPIAVRLVWEASRAAKVPIIGIGGIMTGRDALEFISSALKVLEDIEGYMKRHRIKGIKELVGRLEVV